LSRHDNERIVTEYLPACARTAMVANSGFQQGPFLEVFLITRALLYISESNFKKWMKLLFPYFDVYLEAVNKKGNATDAETSFVKGLLPKLVRVMLQDGAILSEKYTDHEWYRVLDGLDGYVKLALGAHHVLNILIFFYKNGFGGYFMSETHLNFVRTYLDDLLVISCSTFEYHLEKMECVLKILSDKGLRVNAEKYSFCADETEYLGYWISKSDIQPIPEKGRSD
jgi:hypothetical protein